MDLTIIIIGVIIVGVLSFAVYHLTQKINALLKSKEGDKTVLILQEQLKQINERLERSNDRIQKGMEDSTKALQSQFSHSAKIIREVTEKLTTLDETNKQVLGFADKMESLENILKNPKHRGILGEYFLEALLSNVLQPNQYKMQYGFENGEIVDAVIFFNDMIIPIDAKFSLEKYNRMMESKDEAERADLERQFKSDVKIRIDETSKYIRSKESTTDFAFMFIPAEGIYYNLLIYKVGTVHVDTHDLIEYAFKRHVIIVSPTSFFAYLETVLHGLKALKMEANVKEIIKKVGQLGKHLGSYESHIQKMGNSLGTTVNMYNKAYGEFRKIDKDVYRISGESNDIEVLEIEKPKNFDE